MSNINKYRKIEGLHHSRLHPDKVQESTDPVSTFSLPQYIRVMVSNYQPLQRVFAIDKGECESREIKAEEHFSPIVTIVDTATQQHLDCVLLLHGEKLPEVSCRTLFCYIAVQVTVVPYCDDTHDSEQLPYHVKSKLCKQGKLPLMFCFYQSGTVCVIQLSVHSIVDSEGVEYMYNSENCDCIVQIIDRNQHGRVNMTCRHGVVMMKEVPLLKYIGHLASGKYHKLEKYFLQLFLSPNYHQIHRMSQEIVKRCTSADIKVLALLWEAVSRCVRGDFKPAEELLKAAWNVASQLEECENSLLLQGRVLKHLAFLHHVQGNHDKAEDYMLRSKNIFFLAAPSSEKAFLLHTELRLKRRALFSIPKLTFSSELYTSIERQYDLLREHAKYMEEYKEPALCTFLSMKASFHLRSELVRDKLPPKEYWPSPDDLKKAEDCLNSISLDTMRSQINFYTAKYYSALCDLHIWKGKYPEAMHYLEKVRKVYEQMNLYARVHKLDQRLKLLEKLKEDDKINEILKEIS